MRITQWVLLFVLGATTAFAESASDAVTAFQNSIGSSQLVLRNFSGEDKVSATWTGTQSNLTPPLWHTMGVLQLKSVTLTGHKLTLQCVRHVLVKDSQDRLVLYPDPTDVQIQIELGDAEPATVLPRIKNDLFFASIEEAVAAIPKEWNASVPARIDKKPVPTKSSMAGSQAPCDCTVKGDSACDADARPKAGIVPPKFLKGKNPDFTDAARHGMVDAHVVVGLIADKSGLPRDVWVLRPVGMGLDEAAAKSVLTYVFRPATCHDSPVSVYLNVDVRFQRY